MRTISVDDSFAKHLRNFCMSCLDFIATGNLVLNCSTVTDTKYKSLLGHQYLRLVLVLQRKFQYQEDDRFFTTDNLMTRYEIFLSCKSTEQYPLTCKDKEAFAMDTRRWQRIIRHWLSFSMLPNYWNCLCQLVYQQDRHGLWFFLSSLNDNQEI